jgi:hypothetical protein
MRRRLSMLVLSTSALLCCGGVARAQEFSPDGNWMTIDKLPAEIEAQTPWIRPGKAQQVYLDTKWMRDTLASAPLAGTDLANEPIMLWLPKPDGSFERFRVVESPIMLPDLAAQLPDVKTYMGQGVDDPAATVRFDMTPAGFHAQVLSVNGAYYIDPTTQDNANYYASYYKHEYTRVGDAWRCLVEGEPAVSIEDAGQGGFSTRAVLSVNTVRLAVAATAEFTTYHSLTTDTDAVKETKAQAAITTLINRVNGIYENELQTRLLLVNNTNIIYTNSATDPYTDGSPSQMIGANQTTLTSVIGSANYDVGHVVGRTGGGGVAGLGVVCSSGNKGRGVSTFNPPVGDPFAVDYIAHELGHQFNGQHTFAGCGGGTGPSGWALEPGSASTIMGYAGICGADNLQPNSDPFFHHENIQSMRAYIAALTCDGTVVTTNNPPTITAPGVTYVIPQQTPFALMVTSATDVDGDALTYSWEQSDASTGGAVALSQGDLGTSPIFRARAPVTSPTRYFPALDDVIDGTRDAGEFLPSVARTMSFRATVRDNRVGGGGLAIQPAGSGAETRVTINTASGPFTVTNPTGNPILNAGASFTLTWNVANTAAAPVSAANVDILLSTDGGLTFPTVVLSNTPNDGSQAVTIPAVSSTAARFMVRASNNVFFNVSPTFRISVPGPAAPTNVSVTPLPGCFNQPITLSATVNAGETVDWYRVSCGGTLVGTGTSLVVPTPSVGSYFARTRRISDGVTSSTCSSVVVSLNPNPLAPSSATVDRNNFCSDDAGTIMLSAIGGVGTTVRWFEGVCGSAGIATGSAVSIASPTQTTTYFARWENNCGVSVCASVTVNVSPATLPPTGATASRQGFCSADAGTLTLSAIGGAGSFEWFAGSCGGTPVATGASIEIDTPASTTTYFVRTSSACGASLCQSVTVNVGTGDVDFNNDTIFPDDGDILDFFGVLSGSSCPTCDSVDFNGDTVFPDDADIVEFFNVLAGGTC